MASVTGIEKRARQLPPLRVSERLEIELMRLAAADNRAVSDYVRLVLERHAWGHGASMSLPTADGNLDRA